MPRMRVASRSLLLLGSFFLAVGLLAAAGAWVKYWRDNAIASQAASATGQIVRKTFFAAADGDSDYQLEYWFVAPSGQRVDAVRSIGERLWKALPEEGPVEVLYAPADPRQNFPRGAGMNSVGLALFLSALGAAFMLLGGALLMAYFRPAGVIGLSPARGD
ncbi:DUF3592 domain-containing protein [Azoarcus sp. TTM-91]|uniref:DUF3592 domain-containing protein n=1 Tax=Azoarcus sp. TTM-91 TaxID=2691581 RepID=UPI00145CDF42|nr:DUF3592 domain-containing protein [Azoarcus sp. TTM-91]NMG36359.1 DUF3592 domain-containing protein [Azoarcus sp. TTM-91]